METNKTLKQIEEIAWKARYWAEWTAAEEDFDESLVGLCVRTSGRIVKDLRSIGQNASICILSNPDDYYHQHAIVHCGDYYIDVTATQFDSMNKKVEISKNMHSDYRDWDIILETDNVDEVKQHQCRERWPMEQIID